MKLNESERMIADKTAARMLKDIRTGAYDETDHKGTLSRVLGVVGGFLEVTGANNTEQEIDRIMIQIDELEQE